MFRSACWSSSVGQREMSRKIKLLIIAGARPNFMKVAPLIKSVRTYGTNGKQNGATFEYKLVHTGQHYDEKMSGIFFGELGIPAPDINLEEGSGSHACDPEPTSRLISGAGIPSSPKKMPDIFSS